MDTTDPLERLTLLERAQFLHDATLRRHGEMLARLDRLIMQHDDRIAQHDAHLARLDRNYDKLLQIAADLAATNDRIEEQAQRTAVQHAARLEDQSERQRQHDEQMAQLRTIAAQHDERMARLQQTLDAIKDMLDRGNGGP
jgi:predicted RNase H-like nuclease (RuvC/YqgF family)